VATNLQRFTLYYGTRCFVAWDCWTRTSWNVMQRDSVMLIAVSHVHMYFVKRSTSESIAMLHKFEKSIISASVTNVPRAGFKPIWPISSNRAPRQRGPCVPPTTNASLHFYRSCLRIVSAAGPSVVWLFWKTKAIYQTFPTASETTVKTRFTTTIEVHQNFDWQTFRYSDEKVAVSESLCTEQGQNLRKLWRTPQYFVSVGFVSNENPSELRGF